MTYATEQGNLNHAHNTETMRQITEEQKQRPSVVFGAKLFRIKNGWRAFKGESWIGSGCEIYADGTTPEEAMQNFDKVWRG